MSTDDFNNIPKLFSNAKPDPNEISEIVDNTILGHIKEKSREIRRARKVVQLFPRWKQVAVAGMAALICLVSVSHFFRSDISENSALDIDGNGRINIIDAYLMDRRLTSGSAMPKNLDLNRDGYINNADLRIIVDTSVSLEKRDA
jgi:hypothetical protein